MSTQNNQTICTDNPDSSAIRFIIILSLAWAGLFAAYSSFLHASFRSTSLDMALHSQILWNLQHGRFMQTSLLPYSFAGLHFWPGLYFLVPVHQFLGIYGVLIMQSLIIASGAFPAYLLSRDITGREKWAKIFALAYLLQPTLSMGVLFDYHPELFSVPLAMFALLGIRRNQSWFWPCMLLSFCFYEVQTLVFFFAGAGLMLYRDRRFTGLLISALCLVYIALIFYVVMPYFRGSSGVPHWERYAHLGSSPAEAVTALLCHPLNSLAVSITGSEIRSIIYLLLSFGFLPLLSLRHLLPAVPLLLTLILSNLYVNSDIRFGYITPVLPFLFLAGAHGVIALERRTVFQRWNIPHRAPYILLVCSVLLFANFQLTRSLRGNPFNLRPYIAELRQAEAGIPAGASLSADNHLGAHFANRKIILITPSTQYGSETVEYMLSDLNENEFKNTAWWNSMKELIENGNYAPIFLTNDVLLLKKGIKNETLTGQALERIKVRIQTLEQKNTKNR